jgi:Ca2+-binding RTX toxin-like protein
MTGKLRFVGNNFAEDVTFFPGKLGVFPQGFFMLEGNDTIQGSADGELIRGNQDNDLLWGGGSDDTLLGG